IPFVDPANWTGIPPVARKLPEQFLIPEIAADKATEEFAKKSISATEWEVAVSAHVKNGVALARAAKQAAAELGKKDVGTEEWKARRDTLTRQALAVFLINNAESTGDKTLQDRVHAAHFKDLPATDEAKRDADAIVALAQDPDAKAERT